MSLNFHVDQVRKRVGSDWSVTGDGRGLGVFPDSTAAVTFAIAQARAALVQHGRGTADVAVRGVDGVARSIRLVAFAQSGRSGPAGGSAGPAALD